MHGGIFEETSGEIPNGIPRENFEETFVRFKKHPWKKINEHSRGTSLRYL